MELDEKKRDCKGDGEGLAEQYVVAHCGCVVVARSRYSSVSKPSTVLDL